MTRPTRVVIDNLVLRGVRGEDAPAIVASFESHLAQLLAGDAGVDPTPSSERSDAANRGRALAAAVARNVRAVTQS